MRVGVVSVDEEDTFQEQVDGDHGGRELQRASNWSYIPGFRTVSTKLTERS
jgi:hypothetical protein